MKSTFNSGDIVLLNNPNLDNDGPVFALYRGEVNDWQSCVVNLTTGNQFAMRTDWLRPATAAEMIAERDSINCYLNTHGSVSHSEFVKQSNIASTLEDAILRSELCPSNG